jgi:hypothetical protein
MQSSLFSLPRASYWFGRMHLGADGVLGEADFGRILLGVEKARID